MTRFFKPNFTDSHFKNTVILRVPGWDIFPRRCSITKSFYDQRMEYWRKEHNYGDRFQVFKVRPYDLYAMTSGYAILELLQKELLYQKLSEEKTNYLLENINNLEPFDSKLIGDNHAKIFQSKKSRP